MISSADIVIFIIFGILILGSTFKKVRKGQMAAIYRMGRFLKVEGSGTILVIPLFDKVRKIDLDDALPSWRGMSPAEVAEKVRREILKT